MGDSNNHTLGLSAGWELRKGGLPSDETDFNVDARLGVGSCIDGVGSAAGSGGCSDGDRGYRVEDWSEVAPC